MVLGTSFINLHFSCARLLESGLEPPVCGSVMWVVHCVVGTTDGAGHRHDGDTECRVGSPSRSRAVCFSPGSSLCVLVCAYHYVRLASLYTSVLDDDLKRPLAGNDNRRGTDTTTAIQLRSIHVTRLTLVCNLMRSTRSILNQMNHEVPATIFNLTH